MSIQRFAFGIVFAVIGLAGYASNNAIPDNQIVSDSEASALIGGSNIIWNTPQAACLGWCNYNAGLACTKASGWVSSATGILGIPITPIPCDACGYNCSQPFSLNGAE